VTPSCALIAARVALGEWADLRKLTADQREVDARFLRQLLLGLAIPRSEHEAIAQQQPDYARLVPTRELAPVPVSPVGVRVKGANVIGVLDLTDGCGAGGIVLPALALEDCCLWGDENASMPSFEIEKDIEKPDFLLSLDLSRVRIASLSLRKSRFGQVRAREAVIEGGIDLSGVMPLDGWHEPRWPGVDMDRFRQQMWADAAQAAAPVDASFCPVASSPPGEGDNERAAWSSSGRACCWVNLSASRIGGEITAVGAKFRTPAQRPKKSYRFLETRYGLQLSGAVVGGSLIAYGGSVFDGGLQLHLARIKGELWLGGARLYGRESCALDAQGVEVGGVFATGEPLAAHGGVFFNSASIAGHFDLKCGFLDGAGGSALFADSAAIGGDLRLDKGFAARGPIGLAGASVKGKLMLDNAFIDGVRETRGEDEDAMDNDEDAPNCDRVALNGKSLHVGGSATFRNIVTRGCIWLYAARIGDSADFSGAQLGGSPRRSLPDGDKPTLLALSGTAIDVGHSLRLNRGFTARGSVRFQRAHIGKDLEIQNATIRAKKSQAVDIGWSTILGILKFEHNHFEGGMRLRHATTRILYDHDHGYQGAAPLELNGFRYDSLYNCDLSADGHKGIGCTRARIAWLDRMENPGESGYQPQPYAWLAKVLADEGRTVDARMIAIEKHDKELVWRLNRICADGVLPAVPRLLNYLVIWLFKWMFGYGLSPARAGYSIILSFLLGWSVFGLANHRGAMIVDQQPIAGSVFGEQVGAAESKEKLEDRIRCGKSIRAPLYALDVFIPLVDLRQETRCEINVAKGSDRLLPGEVEVYRYFKALYAFGGWLIISLAIVTFTGVLQNRDVQ